MKKQRKVFALLACIAISLSLSCSKEQVTDLQHKENLTKTPDNIQRAMIEKLGEERAAEIMNQWQNPSRFMYTGLELLSGIVNIGEAPFEGFNPVTLTGADFWYFSGNAGDVIYIDVNRISCAMDPVLIVYTGYGETTTLTNIGFADDEDTADCIAACAAGDDPSLTGLILPVCGDYTIAVWDIGSNCSTGGLQSYSIVMTNGGEGNCNADPDADGDGCLDADDPHPNSNMDATVIIDGCDSGIDNQFIDGNCSNMSDLIADCAANAIDHGDFVSCVALLTNYWKSEGYIVGNEKGDIQSCAGLSNLP